MEMTSAEGTETRCRRCKRPLTRSASLGIGPRCAAIEAATEGLSAKQAEKLQQVFADNGVSATSRKGVYRVAASAEYGGTVHIACTNGNCTCEWGARRVSATTKVCYHVAAARLAARPVIRTRPAPAPVAVPAGDAGLWAEMDRLSACFMTAA